MTGYKDLPAQRRGREKKSHMATTTKPETRYNLEVLKEVRDLIAVETNHKQRVWGTVNKSILRKITDRFRPKTYGGGEYIPVSCPTAACVAGWTGIVAGAKMLVNANELEYDGSTIEISSVLTPTGDVEHVSNYAREVLGLTSNEADYLFDGDWTNKSVLANLDAIIIAGSHGREWEINHDLDYNYGDRLEDA